MNATKDKVIQWAKDRNIIPNSTTRTQCLKAVSEIGELADALIKHDVEAIKDAAGDIMVCFYIASYLQRTTTDQICINQLVQLLSYVYKCTGSCTQGLHQDNEADPLHILEWIIEGYDLTLNECIDSAYNVIKDRKGTLLENGVFVKQEVQLELF